MMHKGRRVVKPQHNQNTFLRFPIEIEMKEEEKNNDI